VTRPQAVIFDIGNVLVRWQPEQYYDTIIPRPSREALFSTVDLHMMNEHIDQGAPFRATVYETAARHPEFAELIQKWHDNWLDIAAPAIDGTARLHDALRTKGITTAILSNIGQATFDLAASRYPVLARFDYTFLSGPMGITKPDPAIFHAVETRIGVEPEALLFIDDRPENVAAAAARGWQVHLFETPGPLAKHLVTTGLLSEPEAGVLRDAAAVETQS